VGCAPPDPCYTKVFSYHFQWSSVKHSVLPEKYIPMWPALSSHGAHIMVTVFSSVVAFACHANIPWEKKLPIFSKTQKYSYKVTLHCSIFILYKRKKPNNTLSLCSYLIIERDRAIKIMTVQRLRSKSRTKHNRNLYNFCRPLDHINRQFLIKVSQLPSVLSNFYDELADRT
jgi:hypothetical protein